MISIQPRYRSLSTHLHHLYSLPTGPFSSFRISLSSLSQAVTKKSAQNANHEKTVLLNYLINTLDFPKTKALAISDRFPYVRSVEKPELTVRFFKSIGFTDAQIQSAVCSFPQILLANVEKTLKPKIQLLQELGITGSNLGRLMSKKAVILTRSLDKRLKPSVEVLNKVLIDKGDWFRVLQWCDWVIYGWPPHMRLIPNISYLQSIGIVGSQLSSLLKRQPHLFIMSGSKLKKLVSELMDIGFSTDSRMLVHGLHTLSCTSRETISRKLLLIQSCGFSKNECMEMFRRAPVLFRTSEGKIRLGLEFFLETVNLKKILVKRPELLMYIMKERVIPRYQVFLLIKSKKLVKKGPSFYYMVQLTEHLFLEKFVLRFTENADELLMAYKGHLLD